MFCGPCTKFLVALNSHLSMFAIEIDIKQRILQVEKEFHALLEEFNHLIATEQTSEPRWSRRGKQLGSANAVQSEWCCKYASAVCYSLWLYYGMLLEDYMDRVSDRLLSESSMSEMAIDGRRPPCATRSDIKRLVYISHSPY
jgi:hypothetical protein